MVLQNIYILFGLTLKVREGFMAMLIYNWYTFEAVSKDYPCSEGCRRISEDIA